MIIPTTALLGERERCYGCVDLTCSEKACQIKLRRQNRYENAYFMYLIDAL